MLINCPDCTQQVSDQADLPEYVWPDMPGKVRSVGVHELEFSDGEGVG
jgi:hypothetical protein